MQDDMTQEELDAILESAATARPAASSEANAGESAPQDQAQTPSMNQAEQQDVGPVVDPVKPQASQNTTGSASSINFLLDVPLDVAVELGRTKMAIRDMLKLGPGSVLELDKLIGEPVDLLVNSKLIAKGEVVAFDENFGIRITDIINPEDRLRSLR
jgi:flagellar motor switch protein FliN/FliY